MNCFASADLGGTTVACGIGDAEGRLMAESSIPTEAIEGPAAVLERIAAELIRLACAAGATPSGAGVGIPGRVDLRAGITRFCPNLPTQWRDVPAASVLSERLRCPVYLLNDARLATLGELAFGEGRNARTMLFFTLGTGIGGGVAIGGKLHLDEMGAAGELGHQTILSDGPLCGCGNRGCLEALASGPALAAEGVRLLRAGLAPVLHEVVAGDAGRVTPKTMGEAAARGDANVLEAIRRTGRYLGIGVANLVTALHPELVVFGGGVAALGETLFAEVRAEMIRRVRMFPVDDVRITASRLGDKAGLYGGLALAMRGAG
jgi:glucokinase